jgi:hypothetical protein
MKSKAMAVWLEIAAVPLVGTAMTSAARAQAEQKEGAGTAKVRGYYRIDQSNRRELFAQYDANAGPKR